jgi:hypothetical protein
MTGVALLVPSAPALWASLRHLHSPGCVSPLFAHHAARTVEQPTVVEVTEQTVAPVHAPKLALSMRTKPRKAAKLSRIERTHGLTWTLLRRRGLLARSACIHP